MGMIKTKLICHLQEKKIGKKLRNFELHILILKKLEM